MRILLVEDNSEFRGTLVKVIEKFSKTNNVNIDLIIINSFSELEITLLSNRIDGAIIDKNLSNWTDFRENNLLSDGISICEILISRLSNCEEIASKVFLYSAEKIPLKSAKYNLNEKIVGLEGLNKFRDEILEPLSKKSRSHEISVEKFRTYSIPQKTSFYKKTILNKINSNERFLEFAPFTSWSSDYMNEKEQIILGNNLTSSKSIPFKLSKHINYDELDLLISEKPDINVPTIIWNFNKIDYFEKQDKIIQKHNLENNFVKLFYSIAYANSFVDYLFKNSDFLDTIKSLQEKNTLILREIQCQVIERLHIENESKETINKLKNKLTDNCGFEVIDYFEGYLENFDEENDIARVRLSSMIDSSKYFYKNFSYSGLKQNGIKYKDAKFSYCVSEDKINGGNASFFEPK